MIHQQIHNYKIISRLGEGGMANVYLAENQVLGNQVALKLLKEEFVQHPNIRKRFLAEARNLAQMSHLNVIKVTDLIDAGDIVAFVMEYIEGETLEDYIERKGKLPDEEIETLFKQMIQAVEYVHLQGFIHRDIKPSNFMLTKNGSVKLLDFGIAKNTNDSAVDYTKTGLMQQMGTPMYMSPEQVKNTSEVTKETDIYSLGVVLWQMVTGKKPYDSNTLSLPEIQVAILKEALPMTNTVWDEKIQSLTDKTLKNRNDIIPLSFSSKINYDENVIISKKNKQNYSKKIFVIAGVILFLLITISILISKSSDSPEKIEVAEKPKVNSDNSSSDDMKKNPIKKSKKEDENIDDNGTNENEILEKKKQEKQLQDYDSDGVPDLYDDCPRTYGPEENNGCPYIEVEKPKTVKKNRSVNIYNQNKYSPYGSTSIDKIEITDDYTIFYFTHQLKLANSTWVSIEPNAYIYDKGNNSYKNLIYVSGIEQSPSKTYAKKDNEIIKFKLYFPRVSENCNEIDFIESNSSSWKFYNIKF